MSGGASELAASSKDGCLRHYESKAKRGGRGLLLPMPDSIQDRAGRPTLESKLGKPHAWKCSLDPAIRGNSPERFR